METVSRGIDDINGTAELLPSSKEDRLLVQTVGRWEGMAHTVRMAMHCGWFVESFTGRAR